jgi:hypothetical protein
VGGKAGEYDVVPPAMNGFDLAGRVRPVPGDGLVGKPRMRRGSQVVGRITVSRAACSSLLGGLVVVSLTHQTPRKAARPLWRRAA